MNFETVRLGDICKTNQYTYSLKENWSFVNYLDTGNITKNKIDEIQYIDLLSEKLPSRAKRKVKYNSIIFSTVRPNQLHYGIIKHQPDNFLVSTGFTVIDINEKKANANFLFYLLTQSEYIQHLQAIAEQSTSAYPSIKPSDIEDLIIKIPDVVIQQKISSILSAIDDKIELNNKINANLEQQAQAIFKSWFVDFEPFGSVMPDDWRVGTFSDIIESTLGGDWGKEISTGNYTEKVYCIRGADIPKVKAGNKGKMPTRFILPKNFNNKKLMANDIVVEISGGSPTQSTGRVTAISQALLNRYDSGMVCTNFCRAIKPQTGYSNFIYYYWQYFYNKNVFFSYENGTTGIKNLDITGFIETQPIFIPPVNALKHFNDVIDSVFLKIFSNGQENEHLATLRDILLPKLMNGEIDVENVKI